MNAARASDACTPDPPRHQVRISILHVPGCPLVAGMRAEVETALERIRTAAVIEDIEGAYPSPTLLIDGVEMDGYPLGSDPVCRIDLPTQAHIAAAIAAAGAPTAHTRVAVRMSIGEQRDLPSAEVGCGGRALCGWSPPSLTADTALKRRVDLIRGGNVAAAGIVIVVVGLLNLAAHLSVRPALVVVGLAGLAAGGWCSLNFWRCRHAHCVITRAGLVGLRVVRTGRGVAWSQPDAGYEQPVFVGILGVAVLFELVWYAVHRTNAIASMAASNPLARSPG
jgi:hypothetical protein